MRFFLVIYKNPVHCNEEPKNKQQKSHHRLVMFLRTLQKTNNICKWPFRRIKKKKKLAKILKYDTKYDCCDFFFVVSDSGLAISLQEIDPSRLHPSRSEQSEGRPETLRRRKRSWNGTLRIRRSDRLQMPNLLFFRYELRRSALQTAAFARFGLLKQSMVLFIGCEFGEINTGKLSFWFVS